ncbi:hypothetical protein LRB11_15220 [Ectothiorhodospira haloalkaliphila]|uniref:hypothetical protein n=1 Tax=Ectothiorhodospira haloalkaliphila TaxID=421628 RepID=UPI001EE8CCD1|nr:hypothetical protein [Ectothiorhodospira haloalkaliphila]MCG5526266.1 hypothetical protein [Ectothiorhodospira haloalkaliphila]
MIQHITYKCLLPLLILTAIGITAFLFNPGLTGPFLFDDHPNLQALGYYGAITDISALKAYISSGFSGPTGRPVSLASFLIDARDWPADPYSFKRTNLIIHLLIGGLLFVVINKLMLAIGRNARAAAWIALIATALWLLNPFLVSTTLYVVQRMTQLAALFVLLGFWGYLQGRAWLDTRPKAGYALMTVSVILCTVLATYSKENGALLPLLILVTEFALRYHWSTPGPDWRWKLIMLVLPSLVIVGYLLMRLTGSGEFPHRDFNLEERLLSQPRFLWDYIWHLFVPHIQTQGLFQDGRVVSTHWLSPWTTLPAILGLLVMLIGAIWCRYRWPLVSLAILFFLAGHLIESSTIGLELYFEHRNYLPAVFLFIPVAAGILALRNHVRLGIVVLVAVSLIGSYAAATWQRASLWGDENQLMLVWAEMNPDSPRAQTTAAQTLIRMGEPELAFWHLEQAMQRMPDSGLLTMNHMALRLGQGQLSAAELENGLSRLLEQAFDPQMLAGLRHLVETINRIKPSDAHKEVMFEGLQSIREHLDGRLSVAHRLSFYLQGQLLSSHDQGVEALEYFQKALRYYQSTESALDMVSKLAIDGHFHQALELLGEAEKVLANESDRDLRRGRSTYEMEIERLRGHLLEDIEASAIEDDGTATEEDSYRVPSSPPQAGDGLP